MTNQAAKIAAQQNEITALRASLNSLVDIALTPGIKVQIGPSYLADVDQAKRLLSR